MRVPRPWLYEACKKGCGATLTSRDAWKLMGQRCAPLPAPRPAITAVLRKAVPQPHSWECCRTCVAVINYSAQTTAIVSQKLCTCLKAMVSEEEARWGAVPACRADHLHKHELDLVTPQQGCSPADFLGGPVRVPLSGLGSCLVIVLSSALQGSQNWVSPAVLTLCTAPTSSKVPRKGKKGENTGKSNPCCPT